MTDDSKYKEFIRKIRKLDKSRKHKIVNSYGIRDGFNYYRKIRPKDKEYVLAESQYYSITRNINNILAECLSKGEEIKFPYRLGSLELRKFETKISWENGNLKTNLPIDWNRTTQLWYEDKESYNNKTLIRAESKEIFKVFYNKIKANYTNKSLYDFNVNRAIKIKLKQNINKGTIDAYKLNSNGKIY